MEGKGPFIFSYDGAYAFRIIGDGSTSIKRQTLTTAWSLKYTDTVTTIASSSWAASGSPSYSVNEVYDLDFNDDGTKCFILASTDELYGSQDTVSIIEYSLSTAWDLTTTTYVDRYEVGPDTDKNLYYFHVADSGKKIHFKTKTFSLPTGWDLSNIEQDTSSVFSATGGFEIDEERTSGGEYESYYTQDFYVRDDESRMYMLYDNGNTVTSQSAGINEYFPEHEPSFKLVPFEYSVDDSYMLLFNNNRMFVFKDV